MIGVLVVGLMLVIGVLTEGIMIVALSCVLLLLLLLSVEDVPTLRICLERTAWIFSRSARIFSTTTIAANATKKYLHIDMYVRLAPAAAVGTLWL